MDDLERKFQELERHAAQQSRKFPLVETINRMQGWQKIVAVIVVGIVLFTVVQFVLNLLVGLVTIAVFALIVAFLYKLFFQTDRSQGL